MSLPELFVSRIQLEVGISWIAWRARSALFHLAVVPWGRNLPKFDNVEFYEHYLKYSGNNRIFAIGLTLVGANTTIALTSLVLPVGASAMTIAFVALSIGVPIGLAVDWSKRRIIGY